MFLLFARVPPCLAQTVQGRVLQLPADTPISGALVVLVDSAGRDVARAATSASGGDPLAAGSAGRYRIVVRQIGWQAWTSPAFELAAACCPLLLRIQTEPYALPTITVEARRPRCGIRLGGDAVVSRLLEVAQTALALAQTTADDGTIGFSSEWYLAVLFAGARARGQCQRAGVGRLASWPVHKRAPRYPGALGLRPDRRPRPGLDRCRVRAGPGASTGLDARALFSDWFLASHCFPGRSGRGQRSARQVRAVTTREDG